MTTGEPMSSVHEADRLAAVRETGLTDLAALGTDPQLDTVVALAATLLGTPTAAVNLVDDQWQWAAASYDVASPRDPRGESFCAFVVDSHRPLIVPDARLDDRLADFPAVQRGDIVSYVGVPVTSRDGHPLGALCVTDTTVRDFDPGLVEVLRSLAQLVGDRLDLRRSDRRAGADPAAVERDARELRAALTDGELLLQYQPILSLTDGRVRSVEALLRWQHPDRGFLTPGQFLAQADAAGLTHLLDRWALHQALTTLAGWRQDAPALAGLAIAVNTTIGAHTDQQWAEHVLAELRAAGLPASALTLEVTERSPQDLPADAVAALLQLRGHGCGIAVDDLGTGTSSLHRLLDLPITQVKLDNRFVRSLTTDPARGMIIRDIVRTARGLGLGVTAEGVEDTATIDALRPLGCTHVQGYYYAPPLDADQVPDHPLITDPGHSTAHAPGAGAGDGSGTQARVDADEGVVAGTGAVAAG